MLQKYRLRKAAILSGEGVGVGGWVGGWVVGWWGVGGWVVGGWVCRVLGCGVELGWVGVLGLGSGGGGGLGVGFVGGGLS